MNEFDLGSLETSRAGNIIILLFIGFTGIEQEVPRSRNTWELFKGFLGLKNRKKVNSDICL